MIANLLRVVLTIGGVAICVRFDPFFKDTLSSRHAAFLDGLQCVAPRR